MKPPKPKLTIQRTAYADSYLKSGGKDQWLVSAPGLSVTLNTEDEVLLHVKVHMQLQLEAER